MFRSVLSSDRVATCCDSPQSAHCEHTTLCSAVAIVKSCTPQSADLTRQPIGLMMHDIYGVDYGTLAEHVAV